MSETTANATLEGRILNVTASALCRTGGYSFETTEQVNGSTMVVTIVFNRPPLGAMVTQAINTPSIEATIPVPEGVTRVEVYGWLNRGAIATFDLPATGE